MALGVADRPVELVVDEVLANFSKLVQTQTLPQLPATECSEKRQVIEKIEKAKTIKQAAAFGRNRSARP